MKIKYNPNNTAPTELNKTCVQKFYDYFAPTELIFAIENPIDQLVYQLYELTEEEIKIVEGKWINPFNYYRVLPIAHGLNRGL